MAAAVPRCQTVQHGSSLSSKRLHACCSGEECRGILGSHTWEDERGFRAKASPCGIFWCCENTEIPAALARQPKDVEEAMGVDGEHYQDKQGECSLGGRSGIPGSDK